MSARRRPRGGRGGGVAPPVGADKISSVTDKAKAAIVRTQRSRKRRLARVLDLLENEIWPSIPKEFLGRRFTKRGGEVIRGWRPGAASAPAGETPAFRLRRHRRRHLVVNLPRVLDLDRIPHADLHPARCHAQAAV